MLWRGRRESGNVVDRRAFGAKSLGAGGLIIGAILTYLLGGDPIAFLAQNAAPMEQSRPASPREDDQKKFISVVLADTEDVWTDIFKKNSKNYQEPKLVLFRGAVSSACGRASSAMGPFYCPGDQQVYLDLSFLDDLQTNFGAKGEFSGAYVVAHEVGHHVQTLLGLEGAMRSQERAMGRSEKNQASVQFELQADCLAGLWARHTQNQKNVIDANDIQEALNAAAAVGDDRLQKRSQGEVVPDSFTHGSSEQRASAFHKGYEGDSLQACI